MSSETDEKFFSLLFLNDFVLRACFCQLLDNFFIKIPANCIVHLRLRCFRCELAGLNFISGYFLLPFPSPRSRRKKFANKLFSRAKLFKLLNAAFYLDVIATDLALAKLQLLVWLWARKKSHLPLDSSFLLETVKLFASILSSLLSPPIQPIHRDSLILALFLFKWHYFTPVGSV